MTYLAEEKQIYQFTFEYWALIWFGPNSNHSIKNWPLDFGNWLCLSVISLNIEKNIIEFPDV